MPAKILLFDIETAPNMAHVWRFFKENIRPDMLIKDGYMMSFAAKWLGDAPDKVIYRENRGDNDKVLVSQLIALLDEADMVIAHNGKRFDMGWVRAKAAIHGLKPFSPVKVIDTMVEAQKHFFLNSYSLAYLSRMFNIAPKGEHKKYPGHALWMACIQGKADAWNEMKKYNIQDVITLEQLYFKMRPWITNHPNVAVNDEGDKPACPKCGSNKVHKRGFHMTNVSKFQRYQCQDKKCGAWSRGRFNLYNKDNREALLNNAV